MIHCFTTYIFKWKVRKNIDVPNKEYWFLNLCGDRHENALWCFRWIKECHKNHKMLQLSWKHALFELLLFSIHELVKKVSNFPLWPLVIDKFVWKLLKIVNSPSDYINDTHFTIFYIVYNIIFFSPNNDNLTRDMICFMETDKLGFQFTSTELISALFRETG